MKRKKLLSIFLTLALLCSLLPMAALPAAADGPSGNWSDNKAPEFSNTGENAITITSEAELALLASNVNSGTNYQGWTITLGADLDLSAHYWTPIGDANNKFAGTFNGANHSISGLYITDTLASGTGYYGLFGYLASGGKINNNNDNYLSVSGSITVTIAGGTAHVGGLVGFTESGYIRNVITNVTVTVTQNGSTGDSFAGGLVGKANYTSGTIQSCVNLGAVSGPGNVGGLFGEIFWKSTSITNCSNRGAVTGTADGGYAGGIAGHAANNAKDATFSQCCNRGEVSSDADDTIVGGVIGFLDNSTTTTTNKLTLRDCYNTGNVTGKSYAGGLAGKIQHTPSKKDLSISNCYNAGVIAGGQGIVGTLFGQVNTNNVKTFEYNYYLVQDQLGFYGAYTVGSVELPNAGATGKSAEELRETTIGEKYLTISDGYPILQNQPCIVTVDESGNAAGDVAAPILAKAGGIDYIFTVDKDAGFAYSFTATSGGAPVNVYGVDGSESTYTIAAANVLGDIVLKAEKTEGLEVSVSGSAAGDVTKSAATATKNTAYTFTLTKDGAYDYDEATATVGGSPVTLGRAEEDNAITYTIAAEDVTGNIAITAIKYVKTAYDVSWYDAGENSFTLTTAAQLAGLAQLVNDTAEGRGVPDGFAGDTFQGKTITLGDNIDLGEYLDDAGSWTPIGKNSTWSFQGTFDGNSKTISGLTINAANADKQGLFGFISDGTVKDLTVKGAVNVTEMSGDGSIGGLSGYASGGTFTNVVSDVDVTVTRKPYSDQNTDKTNVGGLAGSAEKTTTWTDCANLGDITGPYYVGGLFGRLSDGTLTNCSNTGSVTKVDASGGVETKLAGCVGGLAGWAELKNNACVGCYNSGAVTDKAPHKKVEPDGQDITPQSDWMPSYSVAGGLFGFVKVAAPKGVGNTLNLTGCYNTGAVTSESSNEDKQTYVGGLVGSMSYKYTGGNGTVISGTMTLSESYNAGEIAAQHGTCGAIFGSIGTSGDATFTISKSYYLNVDGLDAIGQNDAKNVTNNAEALKSNALKTAVKDGKLSTTYYKTGATYPILTWQPDEVTLYGVTVSGSAAADVTAEATATAGEAYSFTVTKAESYDYEVSATVGGTAVTLTEGDNGYTIAAADVTGAIAITANKTVKTYAVTVSGSATDDVTAEATAAAGTAYSFTVTEDSNYDYTVTVTVGGTAYTPSVSGSTYTIAAADVTGAIVITANKTIKSYAVTVSGSAAADVTAATTATAGSAFSFTVTKSEGYDYTVSVTVGATAVTPSESNGTFTIAAADVTGAITITAEKTLKSFTVKFVNADGTELSSAQYAYGTAADSITKPVDPTKASTADKVFTFGGWTPALAEVTGDATYTATYTEATRKYTIKFVNADGTVLQSSEVEYGQTPTYTGATPTKAETASYTYSFKGWDKTIAAVSGEATYTATFTSNAKSSDTGSSGSTVTTPAAQPETTRMEESETAADGSEITTVTEKTEDSKTNADGSVTDTSSEKTTETVSAPDGSKTVTETVAETEITTGTVQNDDGSVTETVASATKETAKETVTDADGNVTETVTETEVKKNVETTVDADGKTSGSGTVETTTTVTDEAGNVLSTAVTEGEISISTAEDGVVSEVTKAKTTITDAEGNVTEETTVTTEAVAPDGSSATVVEDGEGNTLRAEANVSEQAYQAAKESGSPIMIPVTVNPDSEAAISVEMPEMQEGETAQVEIGLTRTGPGVVAYVLRNGEKSLDKTCRLGSLIVTVEGDSELVIIDNDKSFDDVDADKWYGFSVSFVTAREIFNGNGNGTFSPRGRMNRAMVAQVLYNLCRGAEAGNGAVFSDVAESAWYFEAVGWAAENKLIEGWNGAYAPLTSVTRQDLVTILYRYVKFAGYDVAGVGDGVDLGVYGDGAEVSDYAAEAMRWAVGSGLIQGYTDNTLHPKDTATRAEVAALIQRMITEIVK